MKAASGLALALLTALALVPGQAQGDGDPASDALLVEEVFYPYQPVVSPALSKALGQVLREAAGGGLKLKVAIIGSRPELGLEPQFWERPQAYADFLDREISFNGPVQLLVVMPAGLAAANVPRASTLASIKVDASAKTDGLTRAAILGVVALSRASGHTIPTPSLSAGSTSKGGVPQILLFGIPALLLVGAGVLLTLRRSRVDR